MIWSKQRGDTIIEVLIAVAVLGAILGGSFAVASRSLNVSQQAQERSEATKVIESQLELLRFNSATVVAGSYPTGFCFNQAVNPPSIQPLNTTPPTSAGSDGLSTSTYTAICQRNTGGGATYNIGIFKQAGGAGNTFTIQVRWFKVGGNGVEEAKIAYAL